MQIALIIFLCIAAVGITWYSFQTHTHKVGSRAYGWLLKKILNHSVPEISVLEIAHKHHGFLFLDSRQRKEYEISHISNARFISYAEDAVLLSALEGVPKHTAIIVYCSVGYRSEKTAEKLIKMGYTNIYNLYGGLFEWSNQNLPMYDANEGLTNQIHVFQSHWGRWVKNGDKIY